MPPGARAQARHFFCNCCIDKPQDVLKEGDMVKVKITDVDLERHRVSLSIRAVLEDEQAAADDTQPCTYKTGQQKLPCLYLQFAAGGGLLTPGGEVAKRHVPEGRRRHPLVH